ncbi:hypothetical protein Q5P01_025172 [Channa striata]|uniref:Nuclear Testis protein N-terminal domain-containing protein n=1 Tax=Channa striata TaxID=64152 RepID=A0AA88IMW1_CHASR|nr:hypothetical protein Q5P01_025172 [Channa striata]
MDTARFKIEKGQVNKTENEEEEGGENAKLEIGNGPFLEYLDKLCSDENFVRMVEMTLNIPYLDSLLSSDPEPLDLLALEKGDYQLCLSSSHHHPYSPSSSSERRAGLLGLTAEEDLHTPVGIAAAAAAAAADCPPSHFSPPHISYLTTFVL